MNKSESGVSFDYSYFISIGGIGGLFSCAALMIGIASGEAAYGYYAAAAILAELHALRRNHEAVGDGVAFGIGAGAPGEEDSPKGCGAVVRM